MARRTASASERLRGTRLCLKLARVHARCDSACSCGYGPGRRSRTAVDERQRQSPCRHTGGCCFVCRSLARHLPPIVELAQPIPMHRNPAAAHERVPAYALPDLRPSPPSTPVLKTSSRFTAPSGSDARPFGSLNPHGPSGGGDSRQRVGSGGSANSDLDFADLADEDYDHSIGHGGGPVRASVSTPVGAAIGESQREPFESVMLSTPTTSGHIMPAIPCLQVCDSWPPGIEWRRGLAAVLGRRALRSASRTVCAARYCSSRARRTHCGSALGSSLLLCCGTGTRLPRYAWRGHGVRHDI